MGDVEFSESAKTEGLNVIKEVRQDSNKKNWVIFGYENKNTITLTASGEGGLEELKQHLKDDEIQYSLLKVVDIFDNLPVTRFVWIVWAGTHVKIFFKASITTHRGKIKDFIGQSHVTIDASSKEEITEEIISQKVSDASGSSNRVLSGDNQRQQKSGVAKQQGKIETGDLSFLDAETQKGAIAAVRNDKETHNWVLLGYQGQTNNIELIGTGTGGANELAHHLREDLIAFGLVRVEIKFDNQLVTRFALIDFVGNGISTVRKAKTVTFKNRIAEFLGAHHVTISVSDKSELTDEVVLQKVTDIAGTSNKVRDSSAPTSSSNTTAPSSSGSQPKTSAPTSKATTGKSGASLINNTKSGNAVNTASTGLSFDDPEGCKQGIADVRSDENPSDFVLFGYVDNNPTKPQLCKIAGGQGGIQALQNAVENESLGAHYGLVRHDTVVQGTKTVKFVFIIFLGEGIKTIQKAKITTHFGSVKDLIGQFHCDLFTAKKSELTEEAVKEKVNSVTFQNTK